MCDCEQCEDNERERLISEKLREEEDRYEALEYQKSIEDNSCVDETDSRHRYYIENAVNNIIDNLTEDEYMCVIRDALTMLLEKENLGYVKSLCPPHHEVQQ